MIKINYGDKVMTILIQNLDVIGKGSLWLPVAFRFGELLKTFGSLLIEKRISLEMLL
jgi:hypothetical protein